MMHVRGFALLATLLTAGLVQTVARADCRLQPLVELPVAMRDGQPVASAKINGSDVRLVVDSGAFFSMITPAAAEGLRLRLGPAPAGLIELGAGGAGEAQLAKVDTFGGAGVTVRGVQFLVGGDGAQPGAAGLLGQNVLGLKDAEFDLANGVVRLVEERGCGAQGLTYWSKTQPYSMAEILPSDLPRHPVQTQAFVNGARIVVVFDSGASRSFLSPAAARRLGVNLDGPQVSYGGMITGADHRPTPSRIVPVDSFKVGDEEIQHTHLRVADLGLPDVDMVLGADFFLSHHIYVANAQNRIYFTYNGGPVFDLTSPAAP